MFHWQMFSFILAFRLQRYDKFLNMVVGRLIADKIVSLQSNLRYYAQTDDRGDEAPDGGGVS